jgi:hypothetical protein
MSETSESRPVRAPLRGITAGATTGADVEALLHRRHLRRRLYGVWLAMIVCIAVAGDWGYQRLVVAPRLASEEAAYRKAADTMATAVPGAIKNWSATTVEGDQAVQWSGADSELLYVQRIAAARSQFGDVSPEEWRAFMRTHSGRYFYVSYWLGDDLKPTQVGRLEKVEVSNLLQVLLTDGRVDLIHKLGLPQHPA